MEISYALWITLIGMGLVFVAILLLWGLMALLVNVTAEKEPAAAKTPEAETSSDAIPDDALLLDRKRRAAAAAVAAAMALAAAAPKAGLAVDPRAQAGGSQWQAVNRASQMTQIQNASRKKVAR